MCEKYVYNSHKTKIRICTFYSNSCANLHIYEDHFKNSWSKNEGLFVGAHNFYCITSTCTDELSFMVLSLLFSFLLSTRSDPILVIKYFTLKNTPDNYRAVKEQNKEIMYIYQHTNKYTLYNKNCKHLVIVGTSSSNHKPFKWPPYV